MVGKFGERVAWVGGQPSLQPRDLRSSLRQMATEKSPLAVRVAIADAIPTQGLAHPIAPIETARRLKRARPLGVASVGSFRQLTQKKHSLVGNWSAFYALFRNFPPAVQILRLASCFRTFLSSPIALTIDGEPIIEPSEKT